MIACILSSKLNAEASASSGGGCQYCGRQIVYHYHYYYYYRLTITYFWWLTHSGLVSPRVAKPVSRLSDFANAQSIQRGSGAEMA